MSDKDQQGDGVFKKPVKDSFNRVSDRMAEEMSEKTPTEAVRDDVTSDDD